MRDISLVCQPGSRIGIVGPSGCGKTTLLSIAGLLLRPDTGLIAITGEQVRGERHAERLRRTHIAWILQRANAFGDRTALENIRAALVVRGKRDVTEVAEAALDRVGLAQMATERARNLSGGELQRLTLARALSVKPRLLIADEPTASLDAANRDMVVAALFSNLPSDTTLLLASHDPAVYSGCDEIYQLHNGELMRAS